MKRHDGGVIHLGGILGAAEINASGHEINEVPGLAFEFAVTLGVDALGPMGDERRADTAFVHPMFVFSERRVAGVGPSEAVTVIGIGAAGHHLGALLHHPAIAGAARDHVELQIAFAHWLELIGVLVAILDAVPSAHAFGAAAVIGEEENQRVVVLAGGLEGIDHAAHAGVHVRDHGGIGFH